MRMNFDRRRLLQAGFTLVELIVALVVLGVGATGFVILINQATLNSVDPLIRTQANAVAQSYLEEILLLPFCDPDDTSDCPATCTASPCAACSTSEGGNRPVFDDVFDYLNLPDNVVRDRNNNAIAGLGGYSVTVGMQDSGVNFSGLSGNSCQVVRVDVDVTHPTLPSAVTLSGYKVNY